MLLLFTYTCSLQETVQWLINAKRGDVYFGSRGPYCSTLAHSFSNSYHRPDCLLQSTVHVAVGFCDLGALSASSVTQEDETVRCDSPLRWIGINGALYGVAKAEVVAAMLRAQAPVDDILQVRLLDSINC
jgi:hypothetical protein